MQNKHRKCRKPTKDNNINVLIIIFQSCKNKVSELEIHINTTDPDIIIGNETWLKPDIKST